MGLLRLLRFLLVFVLLAGLTGCSGGTPGGDPGATAPGPVAEVPKFFTFPKDVDIDFEKVRTSGPSTMKATVFGNPGDDVSDAIERGASYADQISEIHAFIMGKASTLTIPVDSTLTFFEGEVQDGGDIISIKIDFGIIDVDGDSIPEGCTGCTCPTHCNSVEEGNTCPPEALLSDLDPICYRVWWDHWIDTRRGPGFNRLMLGLFDRFPILDDPATPENEDNPGKGQFRVFTSFPYPLLGPNPKESSDTVVEVIYNHLDIENPFDKSTEFSSFTQLVHWDTGPFFDDRSSHIKMEQEGLPDAGDESEVMKTIRATKYNRQLPPSYNPSFEKYIARFLQNDDFWSGSVDVDPTNPPFKLDFDFDSACAPISTGIVIDRSRCRDLGIDVGDAGLGFLDFTDINDIAFPDFTEFPETP